METDNQIRPADILLVEDNPGDVRLLQEMFKDSGIMNTIRVAKDGIEAIHILTNGGAPKPDIIFLDLNMPRKNGLEVLADVKKNPALKNIPIIVLTSSSAETDIIASRHLDANAYLTKPVEFYSFIQAIRAIVGFRVAIVKRQESEGKS